MEEMPDKENKTSKGNAKIAKEKAQRSLEEEGVKGFNIPRRHYFNVPKRAGLPLGSRRGRAKELLSY